MTSTALKAGLRPTLLAVAVLAAFGAARAQGAAPAEGDKAKAFEASVSVGAAWVSGDSADRAFFGQYNGMRQQDVYGLLGFDYLRTDSDTGTSIAVVGTNLGLQTRELLLDWRRQGDWRFSAGYGELVRREPFTVNTGMSGGGTTTPMVIYLGGGAGSGPELDLQTKRKGFDVGLGKWFGSTLEFSASLKSENKDGARLFGVGMSCPSFTAPGCGATSPTATGAAVLLLPEPINQNHSQIDARLNYAGEQLRLSAGYYGSFFNNSNGTLNPSIPGTLNNAVGTPLPVNAGLRSILGNPVALPPENQSHTLDLTGNYVLTPTTRATFKVAYSQARQDQGFADAGLAGAPAGQGSLDGKVDTTLAQVGLSARPLRGLTLLAEGRYEDRNDKTPIAAYNVVGTSAYTNRNYSFERVRGKLQANYQFTPAIQGTAGVDYDAIDRAEFTPGSAVLGVSALRQDTQELRYRLELRQRMTETVSGEIRYARSDRDGSNWLRPNTGTGVTEVADPATGLPPTAIYPSTLADRKRDEIKVSATWQATDALLLQFSATGGKDEFPTPSSYAVRESRVSLYSVDASYALSDAWNLTGFASYGSQELNQARPAGAILAFDNTNITVGAGMNGRIGEKTELGASLAYIDDRNSYAQSLDPLANPSSGALLAATGGLPDVKFQQTELRLFGKYLLAKNSSLRLDAIFQRTKYDDWAYQYGSVPYLYSDNTTVTIQPQQNVFYLGVSYAYSWR